MNIVGFIFPHFEATYLCHKRFESHAFIRVLKCILLLFSAHPTYLVHLVNLVLLTSIIAIDAG